MKRAAAYNGKDLPESGYLTTVNRIPPARGMGSSSAAIVGGIVLGNALTGNKMGKTISWMLPMLWKAILIT